MIMIKRFIKTAMTYLAGNVLSKLIAILLLPLYTSYLTPNQYGTFDLTVSILSFLLPVAFFQIWDGMFRFAFDYEDNREKYGVISNAFFIGLLGTIIYSVFFWGAFIVLRFENVILVFVYGLSMALNYQYTFIARAFIKNKLFVISGLINSLLSALINVLLIVVYNFGVESLFIAPTIGSLFQILLIEINLRPLKYYKSRDLNRQMMISMLKFSVPLCIATVSYWLLSGFTKLVIYQNLGAYENGLYAVASKFAAMITLVVGVFQYAWNEMAYLLSGNKDRITTYQKGINYIFKVVVLGSCVLLFIIKLIFPMFIDAAFQQALVIVPSTLLGVSINAFAGFIGTIFLTEKRTSWIFWSTIFAALFNVLSVWLFVNLWGLQGAVGALSLSFVILAAIRIFMISKVFILNIPRSWIYYIIFLCIIVYLFYVIESTSGLIIAIFLLCIIALYLLKDILSLIWLSKKTRKDEKS
ncbi:oligosaccharide flippase family protein [Cytobacillus firmus]|uniref:lipopolysaccharide biosynthesis protein n=1 Tax=Cytobacillus firmus TaxID=1399 RepID=UPI0024C18958|nr:oligosaccharide flippase family protein [Cytobacillus firmus]WHY33850.1 oligosaccharide flippase family protein [Cytobacillus firmus]